MTATFTATVIAIAVLIFLCVEPRAADAQEKLLKPGDQINLSIGETPPSDTTTISGVFTVSKAGTLRLPRLEEELKAAGIVPSKVMKMIEKAYRDSRVFKTPRTAPRISMGVKMSDQAMRSVRVLGEVKGGGDVPYRPDLTLRTALSARGGLTELADIESVRLIRDGTTTTHNLENRVTAPQRDIKLKPGDKIIVSRKKTLEEE